MKKIIIIGAGQGGLRAGALLAEKGWDVTVYEKQAEDTLSPDWFDGISVRLFEDLEIPVPADSFKGYAPTFIGPETQAGLFIRSPEESMDWSVNRRTLSAQLVAFAKEKGVKFEFETKVKKLTFSNTAVTGVTVNGKDIAADLVIDASGMNSPFRASLPLRAGIQAMPEEDEVFNVYRGVYRQVPGLPLPAEKDRFRMYLKYQGKKSISWCGMEPSGELNVLVGMIGKMDLNSFNQLYAHLKMDNPIIDTVIDNRCAETPIPVRYPLTRFSYPGYTAIGDSAFMTIPVMGSGVENALRAGQMLAESLLKADSVDMNALWDYQVKYYRNIGAVCYLLDWVKRGLLATDNGELKQFIESGAVTDEDIYALFSGNIREIPLEELLHKPAALFANRRFIGSLLSYIVKGLKAAAAAISIPPQYDTLKIAKWAAKAEKAMQAPRS